MALEHIFEPQERLSGWVVTEKLTFLYTAFTTLLVFIFWTQINAPLELLGVRALIIGGIVITNILYHFRPSRATLFLRQFYPLTLLGVWYPDTYEFCQLFPYLDHLFAAADAHLFGCQPSLVFSELLSGKIWSELFHMGYFSYFPMIMLTVLASLFTQPSQFSRTTYVVLGSFFLYYLIYLFLPVAGPQCYFQAVGVDSIRQGIFPEMGDWFRTHTEMMELPGPDGFFRTMIQMAHEAGERPTAAFPSSHVGASTILMFLLYRNNRKLLWYCLPFYVFLCGATVYIHAHYLVDVFGGFISAILFYWLLDKTYPFFAKKSPEQVTASSR